MYHRSVTETAFRVLPACFAVTLPEEQEVVTKDVSRPWLLALVAEPAWVSCSYVAPPSSNATFQYSPSWLESVSDTFERKAPVVLERTLKDLVSNSVRIPRRADVSEYLRRHPDMIELVEIVSKRTAQMFSRSGQVSLETYKDPEFEDEYLTLYVRQKHYDQTVLDAINHVGTAYSGQLAEKSGWLLVTTDFQPPR